MTRGTILVLAALALALAACNRTGTAAAARAVGDPGAPGAGAGSSADGKNTMVRVRVFGKDGQLSGPVETPKVVHSDAEWRRLLTPDQYRIARASDTEPPFCGGLLHNKGAGVYVCVGCGLPLFASDAKFESGTGWPSFFQPIAKENIFERTDASHGMARTEILCPRCESHLGHVFEDGPRPTGLRYCLNSEVLRFVPQEQLATLAEPVPATQPATQPAPSATAVFAGGCFWCTEAVFRQLKGVSLVESGYSGGKAETANYDAVCTGTTGHAEAIRITYDPAVTRYEDLLEVFFATHDPTQRNRQGPDSGPQYRSAIFYASPQEKQAAEAYIRKLTDARAFVAPIVTALEPLQAFYPAESYHQDYVRRHPDQPYVCSVALPKVQKVREKFPERVK